MVEPVANGYVRHTAGSHAMPSKTICAGAQSAGRSSFQMEQEGALPHRADAADLSSHYTSGSGSAAELQYRMECP